MLKCKTFVLGIVLFATNTSFAQTNPALVPYITYLNGQNSSAKDYVLGLFKTHDIVVICERMHTEMTQYDLLTDIISDKRFIDNVGNIFTEIGLSTLNPGLNQFLHNKDLPAATVKKQVMYFQRNCSMWPAWTNANYSYFINSLYTINSKLPGDKAINVYPSDIPFSWQGADTAAMIKLKTMMNGRDSIIAAQIIAQFDKIKSSGQKRQKALVIMNYRHAFNKEFVFPGGQRLKNVAYYLFQKYHDAVANVLLNATAFNNKGEFELLQDGKWDAAFKMKDKSSLGFDLNNSPFGKDSFDIWPYKTNFNYQDIFTGFVFYQPIEAHRMVEGIAGYADSVFSIELLKRIELIALVNSEFRSKMAGLKRMLEGTEPAINIAEDRKYFNLDSLQTKRGYWLK